MATVSCTFGGRTSYNNGWTWKYFYTATNWGHLGFGKDRYGHNRCIVLKVTTPSLPSTYINKKLVIKIPMCRSSDAGSGTDTFYYRVTTTAPTFSEGGMTQITFPSSYICSGSVDIYNQSAGSGYTLRTITTGTANFAGGTTYYIWLWSNTPYVSGSNYYAGYYAHHSSYGGLISVAVDYTLQQKSTLTVANGTLGTAQTLKVTQQDTSTTHTITYSCGSASGTICTKSSSTSISWTPPLSLASQNTTGTSLSVKFTITTYNSAGTSVGSNSYTKTFAIPSSIAPTCTIAISDATGYKDIYGGYILGLSKLKVVVAPTLAYNSPIAKYKTTVMGLTYTSASFTTSELTSRSITISATVTDKRGRSSKEVGIGLSSVNILGYSRPTISSLKVKRCNGDGTENHQGDHVQITFSAKVTALENKNIANYTIEYKKSSDLVYTTLAHDFAGTYTLTDASVIFPADTGSSYDIKLTVSDNFYSTPTTTVASTAFTLMHWLASGFGMAIGKLSELTNVLDIGFQTRFMGGILQPVLEQDTDFNKVMTPNTYTLKSTNGAGYTNCPLESGTGLLKVESCGEVGQLKQTVTVCHKTTPLVYERFYYQDEWGDWLCTTDFDGTLLWSGGYYMTSGHTITLSENVSKQRTGIVLVFSEYVDDAVSNTAFHTRFIPKYVVANHISAGHCIQLTSYNATYFATKYLYIADLHITGHDQNNKTGTGNSGITYTNDRFVLRYVIGV